MTKYYKGNSIYELIESTHNFRYASDDLWILVYGNRECDPKVILLLSEYSENEFESETLKTKESEIMIYTEQISHRSGVPFLYVRFNKDASQLKEVKIMMSGKFRSISLEEYTNILVGYGIQKDNLVSKKPINSHASNVYHLWQINSGLDIITSDIDLMHINSNMDITDVYELKRSYIDINKWEPFPADFNNFILLSKLFNKSNINFYIMFNQYHKLPYVDDIKVVKLYKVKFEDKLVIESLGKLDISDFLLSFTK